MTRGSIPILVLFAFTYTPMEAFLESDGSYRVSSKRIIPCILYFIKSFIFLHTAFTVINMLVIGYILGGNPTSIGSRIIFHLEISVAVLSPVVGVVGLWRRMGSNQPISQKIVEGDDKDNEAA